MFKKPKRNFRTRKAQEDGSDAENDDNKDQKMEIAGETYIVQETAAEDDPVSFKNKKKKKADNWAERWACPRLFYRSATELIMMIPHVDDVIRRNLSHSTFSPF